VPVATAVKVSGTETVAAAAPQKSKSVSPEIFKDLRKVRNDRGTPPRRRSRQRGCGHCWCH
jgi:hypothetical protein